MVQGMTGKQGRAKPRRIVTAENRVVIIDEHFAFSLGSVCSELHEVVYTMVGEWTEARVGVYAPPCWDYDILKLVMASEADDSQDKKCVVDLLDIFSYSRVRPFGFPNDVFLNVLGIAHFLERYESEHALHDAQYLALAEAIGATIWTTDAAFKERMDNISRIGVFEEFLNPHAQSEEPTTFTMGDRSGYRETRIEIGKLIERVFLVK